MYDSRRLFSLVMMTLVGCSGGAGSDTGAAWGDRYHPADFAQAAVHGAEAKFAVQDCKSCHGERLDGGVAQQSCDGCHSDGWQTNCTFCHGEAGGDGAPPQGLDDSTEPSAQVFPLHALHLGGGALFDGASCASCHQVPTEALSSGHMWDGTAGVAELDFSGGVNAGGDYTSVGCANSYCHGDGKGSNGDVLITDTALNCGSCHGGPGIGLDWLSLSGKHAKHLWEGISCSQCHGNTVDTANQISGPSLHVNGQVDLQFTDGTVTYSNGQCSGRCHGEGHNSSGW